MKRRLSTSVLALLPALLLLAPACKEGDGETMDGADDAQGTGSDGDDGSGEDADDGGTDGGSDDGDETGGSGDDPDGGSDDGEPGGGDSLQPLVQSLCEWDFQCCSDGELDYRLGPFTADAADCTARFMEQVMSNDDDAQSPRSDLLYVLGYAIDLTRSEPNPDAVQACAMQLASRPCNAPWNGEVGYCEVGSAPGSDPCHLDQLFTGKLAPGDLCSAGLAGLADIECGPGSTCEQMDGEWECVDKGLLSEFCEADDTCDGGLFCDITTGLCAAKSELGQPCAFEDAEQPDAGTESLPCLESLTCDPVGGTCVAFCSERYACGHDAACPETMSCIPHDIGDGTYRYCADRGAANGDRCDTHYDCADGLHCDDGACATDLALNIACGYDEECEAGMYCSGTCQVVKNAGQTCLADYECNPSTTIGCITSDDGRQCRTALLGAGDRCTPGENSGANWCATGLCENLASDESPLPVCHVGAPLAAPCDANDATFDVLRCASALYCDEGVCAAQVDSGQDCSDDQAAQCLNGHCVEIWSGEYCSDLPPVVSDDLVTCDGQ